jgi:hypothetical protein
VVTKHLEGTAGIFEFSREFYLCYLLVDLDSLTCCLRRKVAISDKTVNTVEAGSDHTD